MKTNVLELEAKEILIEDAKIIGAGEGNGFEIVGKGLANEGFEIVGKGIIEFSSASYSK